MTLYLAVTYHAQPAARECGPLPDEPFIQMAFLSLPVIPALKLTSQGLFDGEKFAFTTLEVTE